MTSFLGKTRHPAIDRRLKEILREVKRENAEIKAPFWLTMEVANGIRFTIEDEIAAEKVLNSFFALPVNYFPFSNGQITEVLLLSLELGTTVYDTAYHFLAILLDGTFLTCDREYYKRASKLGHIEVLK
ncbi:MAG: type II toxin-antitoxin system VapC family toxin [bacterium]|nr:type II toxin-antitoxin system VapC family toxin [bacterium]